MFMLFFMLLGQVEAANIYTLDRFSKSQMPWSYPANDQVSRYLNQSMAKGLNSNNKINIGTFSAHNANNNYIGTKENAIKHARSINKGSNLIILNTVNTVELESNYKLVVSTEYLHKHSGRHLGSGTEEIMIPKSKIKNCLKGYDVSEYRCKDSLDERERAYKECSDTNKIYRPKLSCIQDELDKAANNLSNRAAEKIKENIESSQNNIEKPIIECISNTSSDNRNRTKIKMMSPLDDFSVMSNLISVETYNERSNRTLRHNSLPIDSKCEIKNGKPVFYIKSKNSKRRQLSISPPSQQARFNTNYINKQHRNMTCTYEDLDQLKSYCKKYLEVKSRGTPKQKNQSRGRR